MLSLRATQVRKGLVVAYSFRVGTVCHGREGLATGVGAQPNRQEAD